MGAAQSRREGSSLYDDGTWTPPNHGPLLKRTHRISEPTDRNTREISGALVPVNNLSAVKPFGDYIAYHETSVAAPASEKSITTRLKTKVLGVVGWAGNARFGRAVDALDTIGSSMTSLNKGSGFGSAATSKGDKIEILAFEVANTIARGYGLKKTLSKESIKVLKKEVLCSEGVQRLVSQDMMELISIAAEDIKKELTVFAKEVVRFGNQCRDPQWHNLDRDFDKLGKIKSIPNPDRKEVEEEVQTLLIWAQQTGELYHELSSLERFEEEIRRKLQDEEVYDNYSREDHRAALKSELKARGKSVKILKKKSLWSKSLEEVMEKLVDAVYFLHLEIEHAFGNAGESLHGKSGVQKRENSERLGPLGLALHYACIIGQISSLVSSPGSIPLRTRANLYQRLPPRIKGVLRHKMRFFKMKKELTISHVNDELENMLTWLVPIASNTTKAHHGFGWVGEWANTGSLSEQLPFSLVETLHHADQAITEEYILELLILLHSLICLASENVEDFREQLHPSSQQAHTSMLEEDVTPCVLFDEGENMQHPDSGATEDLKPEKQANVELERPLSRGAESLRELTKSSSHSSSHGELIRALSKIGSDSTSESSDVASCVLLDEGENMQHPDSGATEELKPEKQASVELERRLSRGVESSCELTKSSSHSSSHGELIRASSKIGSDSTSESSDVASGVPFDEGENVQYPDPGATEELKPEKQASVDLKRRLSRGLESSRELTKSSSHSFSHRELIRALSKMGSDSTSESSEEDDATTPVVNHVHVGPVVDFQLNRIKSLDIIDRVDDI